MTSYATLSPPSNSTSRIKLSIGCIFFIRGIVICLFEWFQFGYNLCVLLAANVIHILYFAKPGLFIMAACPWFDHPPHARTVRHRHNKRPMKLVLLRDGVPPTVLVENLGEVRDVPPGPRLRPTTTYTKFSFQNRTRTFCNPLTIIPLPAMARVKPTTAADKGCRRCR